MDKPLKYFLIASVVFFVFVVFILINSQTDEAAITTVPHDYPLLFEAEELATNSVDTFFLYYPKYPNNSFVKFRTKAGELWGKVLYVKNDIIRAAPIKVPTDVYDLSVPKELDLAKEQLLDWLIELPNGKVRGGFTSQAVFIYEKTQTPSTKIDSQLNLFVDQLPQNN